MTSKQLYAWKKRLNAKQRHIDRLQRRLDVSNDLFSARQREYYSPERLASQTAVLLALVAARKSPGPSFANPAAEIGTKLRIEWAN